ncbi:hypothetical protein AK812_SmicGene41328 [Symbiodinium microadriaticum]|uniref:Uncharacterized protein n=1 Tax=Symbiodinium microadriaticum TaxID=2951 RepID=A0A1Q9C6D1_SYMMI|nr:hypothetical protein AK812_SmicGene41328 [Symbiodinium microadriaticum]
MSPTPADAAPLLGEMDEATWYESWKALKQLYTLENMLLKWFPTGIRIRLDKESAQPKETFQVIINGKPVVTKKWENFTVECESGLWPTDRAKIRAEMSNVFENAMVSAHEFPSEGDFSIEDPALKPPNDPITWVAPTVVFCCVLLFIYTLLLLFIPPLRKALLGL